MRFVLLSAALCAALALAGVAAAADDPLLAPGSTCGPASDSVALDRTTAQTVMLCFTNYARTQSGLAPLSLNAPLSDAGNAKLSADVSCGVFSHEPCGNPFDAVFASYLKGATSYRIGENIAWGTGSYGTPRQIMDAWLHSSGHRENILTASFTEVGIGYLGGQTFQGYSGAALWSQQFGTRTPVADAGGSSASSTTAVSKPKPVAKPKAKAKKKRRLRPHSH